MDTNDLKIGTALIRKDFQLDEDSLVPNTQEEFNYDFVLQRLTNIVDYLIGHDFNRLLNALYRIDVSEEKLKGVLAERPDDTAQVIAEMILEREMQKVAIRKRYQNGL